MMTDEEYRRFLTALAGKHLRIPPSGPNFSLQGLQADLDRISAASRHLMALRHEGDTEQLNRVVGNLEEIGPLHVAKEYMTACGILDALDDAPDLVLGELRRTVIPSEDEEYLRRAGFDINDVEVLLALAVHRAHAWSAQWQLPSDIAEEGDGKLGRALESLRKNALTPKRGKLFNGIGKLIGGAVAGIGNVLLLMGTLTAPNPATGLGAIASGGLAVSSIFSGIGDLRGE